MPTSPYTHLTTIVEFLIATRPTSLLDIGLGNGKLGFIARDLLDVMLGERGKFKKKDWKTKIDGIEIFADYIQDHQKAIYDEIFIGNAFDVIDTLRTYDMIVLGDVLEHFEKNQARQFFGKCIAHSNKHLIVCIPLGEKWTQSAIYGNPYERHLSFWSFGVTVSMKQPPPPAADGFSACGGGTAWPLSLVSFIAPIGMGGGSSDLE